MFHYLQNLVSTKAIQGNPWDFKPTQTIPEDVRTNKTKRQAFYSDPRTDHSFYSPYEPLNPNARLSKEENPPVYMTAAVLDYDTLNLPHERVYEGIKLMPFKPTRIEESLGRNWRLVFEYGIRIPLHNYDFSTFLAKKLKKWLAGDVLPCLDEQALESPTRYYANGCRWIETGDAPIPKAAVQAFFVECAREFAFNASQEELDMPMDVIEKAVRAKFPDLNWPSNFEVNSQGPSFWIPGSTSPMSAIIKPGGMVTFSAHAVKTFYTWGEILGKEFVATWSNSTVLKATENIFFNGHDFYMKDRNTQIFLPTNKDAMQNHLRVNARISTRPDKQTGLSQMDLVMNHIYHQNRVASAGPHVLRRPGVFLFEGRKVLNTYGHTPIEPAAGKKTWDDCPFLYAMLRHLFNAAEGERQFWHFIAWLKRYFIAAYTWDPLQGHNAFIAGVHGCGKTLLNTFIIPALVGGSADAQEFVLGGSMFNAHLYEVPHWTIDDDTIIGTAANSQRASFMFKKIAANRKGISHAKFQQQAMVEWCGRMGITLNMDATSMRLIGPQDPATLEKNNLYLCNPVRFHYPVPAEVQRILSIELPILARVLLDIEIPPLFEPNNRYGFEPYHDATLLERTNQSNPMAPFKELLIEALIAEFRSTTAPVWKGTLTQIMRLLAQDPRNDNAVRSMKMDQVNRWLEQIQKEKLLKVEVDTAKMNTRVFSFFRTDFQDALTDVLAEPAPILVTSTDNVKNPFEK